MAFDSAPRRNTRSFGARLKDLGDRQTRPQPCLDMLAASA
jgi:hypothetical protein